jgi:hypothetical protein
MKPDHYLKQQIIAEILAMWPELPPEFYGWHLSRKVRAKVYHLEMRFPYDDTVLRYLRQLRDEGAVSYDVIKSKSIYRKTEKQ